MNGKRVSMPEGAGAFLVEEFWSPGDASEWPTDSRRKELCRFRADSGWIYTFTRYGVKIALMQPNEWGVMAPAYQPPLFFLGRQYWGIKGVGNRAAAQTKGYDEVVLSPNTSRKSFDGFAEFDDYGVYRGDAEIAISDTTAFIELTYGRYTGAHDLPPSPNDRLIYRAVLSGYRRKESA